MVWTDTFWTYIKGRAVEVYFTGQPFTNRAVDPNDFSGVIYRSSNDLFDSKPGENNARSI